MKLAMTNFSLRRPWLVIAAALILTILFGAQFPKVFFDNDPENMLSEDEHVRVFHNQVKEKYSLYDFVIVGVVNKAHPDGIFNVGTLGRIDALTRQILSLRRSREGTPAVAIDGEERPVDLTPSSPWRRALNAVFRHDPNDLFGEHGDSAIIGREVIAPSVVDNIKQAELGSLKLEYLMEDVPTTREEALAIRDNAMGNPLYSGTLVAEDEQAICLYLPLIEKTYSYNVASLVRKLTADWNGDEEVYITGLPVAEDTFGIEMLVQMATSAPLAGLVIFLLMLVFFRRISLVIAPMIVAMLSVVFAMGLLVGLGLPVHIMSSMIAIFLMPIAVADAVHILSEFFDVYPRFQDKAKTVRHVIGHLFMPMLYTSLTTIAGFGSLWFTPIPPVKVFGAHVAFGVAVAWLLTMTLVPAYIMVAVPERRLRGLRPADHAEAPGGLLGGLLARLGGVGFKGAKLVIALSVIVLGVSVYGICLIRVNDNPVKWFTKAHPIRVADAELNRHFGGTYTAYLTFAPTSPDAHSCDEKAAALRAAASERFGKALPEATREFITALDGLAQNYRNATSSDVKKCLVELTNKAGQIDERAVASWNALADEVNYLEPEGLTYDAFAAAVQKAEGVTRADGRTLVERMAPHRAKRGADLQDAALGICDEFTALSFREFVFEMEAELTAPLFKRPDMLRWLEDLQRHMREDPIVGKTSSAVDALKKAAYELRYVAPPADADDAEAEAYEARNGANFSVPETSAAAAQVYTQLEGMKKKDSLFHLVTRDYREANLWVQLKSGDNRDMEEVVAAVGRFIEEHPPPAEIRAEWAGLTYLNVVWQQKMVKGMLSSLTSSFVVVFIMMVVLFRSPLYGVLAMIPLSVTIAFIYGLIGIVGKDYDMPVAVLSALTLGLSVDFAIHFLERAREEAHKHGSWVKASAQMFKEPAMAISRNAITISVGFTPLLAAPLVPYRTVGFFLATIMAVSWLATLLILPALLTVLERWAFKKTTTRAAPEGGGD